MTKRHFLTIASNGLLVAFVAGFLMVASAQAQVSDTQGFTVRVPNRLTITPPAPAVSITHDETANDQTFAAQQWAVKANSRDGATVVFSTDQAFTHTADASFKRDAKLDLAIASSSGPASWTLAVASDQTDHAASDEIATVQAGSTAPGKADFDLTVTFITGDLDTLAEGDYSLTITGTLTAN
jgi:hypothetical protein